MYIDIGFYETGVMEIVSSPNIAYCNLALKSVIL